MGEADCPVGLCGSSIGMCKHIHSLLPLPESNRVQSLFFAQLGCLSGGVRERQRLMWYHFVYTSS